MLGPALQDRYDLSLSEVGIAFSSVWIGPIATLLPWGLLSDRIGERIVLASGLAGCGLLVATAGWASSFWLLIALLTIAGALGASVNAASGRAVMQWFSAGQRGLALGVRQTAIPVGGAVAALALPAVNSAAGLKASFVFLGAICIGCALFAGIAVHEADKAEAALAAEDVEWTLRALRAGKHVLCEKPLTRDPAEAEEVFDVAAREGRLVMEGFMWAHAPQIRRVHDDLRHIFCRLYSCAVYSRRSYALKPCRFTSSSRSAAFKSSRTISCTRSLKRTFAVQPSCFFALLASPNSESTSVGRK